MLKILELEPTPELSVSHNYPALFHWFVGPRFSTFPNLFIWLWNEREGMSLLLGDWERNGDTGTVESL